MVQTIISTYFRALRWIMLICVRLAPYANSFYERHSCSEYSTHKTNFLAFIVRGRIIQDEKINTDGHIRTKIDAQLEIMNPHILRRKILDSHACTFYQHNIYSVELKTNWRMKIWESEQRDDSYWIDDVL